MRREDKKKLILNRRIIVGHLRDLEGVLDYLISKQIFTPTIRERINVTLDLFYIKFIIVNNFL